MSLQQLIAVVLHPSLNQSKERIIFSYFLFFLHKNLCLLSHFEFVDGGQVWRCGFFFSGGKKIRGHERETEAHFGTRKHSGMVEHLLRHSKASITLSNQEGWDCLKAYYIVRTSKVALAKEIPIKGNF